MALDIGLLNVLVSLGLDGKAGTKLADDIGSAVGGAAEKATKSFSDKFSQGLSSVGKKASVALTAPLVAFGTKGVFDAQKVSAGLAEVVSLTGQTGEVALTSIKNLSGEVSNLSGELGIAQETLVAGLYSAISAGVPRDNVFEFLEVAGKAAIAGVTDTNTAVDGLTTIINAFGLSAGDAGIVADSLFTAVKGGKTTFQELSDSLFNVAPSAAAAGVDFQTVNAAIAALTAAGVPTSVATTQIRAALVGLQKPSKELDALFGSLGFETRAAAIEALGFQGALGAVKDAAKGDQGALQGLLGSVEAVGAVNILAGTGADKFTAELKAQEEAAGSTNDAFALIDKTRDFERLKVDLQNLSVTIGNVLLPFVKEFAKVAGDLTARFQSLSPETQDLIVKIGVFAAAIGPVLIITGKLITSVKLIIGVVKLLNVAFLANPFVLFAVAAVAAVVLIVKYWDEISAFFKKIFADIVDFARVAFGNVVTTLQDAFATIGEVLGNLITAVGDFFQAIGEKIGNFITGVGDVFTAIGEGIGNFITGVGDFFTAVGEKFGNFITGVGDGFAAAGQAVGNFITGVGDVFSSIGQTIGNFITGVKDAIVGVAEAIGSIVKGVADIYAKLFTGIINGFSLAFSIVRDRVKAVYDFFVTVFGRIQDFIRRIVDTIRNLPSAIAGGIGGIFKGIIPGFADGGVAVGGRPAIVGERGPELIVPGRTSTVIPNAALGGLGGGVTYQITVNNPTAEPSSTSIPQALRRAAYLRG